MSSSGHGLNSLLDATEEIPLPLPSIPLAETTSGRRLHARAFRQAVKVAEISADFLTGAVAVFAASYASHRLGLAHPAGSTSLLSAVAGVLVVLLFQRDSAYRGGNSLLRIGETERALRIPCLAVILLLPFSLAWREPLPCGVLICLPVFLPLLLLAQKHFFLLCVGALHLEGRALAPPHVRRIPQFYLWIKRFFDVAISLLLLVLLLPLLLVLALLIKLDSPGPVLFRQERVGIDGRRFNIVKFRSMHIGSPRYARSPVQADDRRITHFGRFLRRSSFDELPQLLNVLRGEMSLVGPRPEMPFLVDERDPLQRERLRVTPGITGLWQLSADRAFPIHENLEHDLYYIRSRGFFLDVAILIHTAFSCMRGI
jgi:lipopolysaccharide/colanic/teichoic acid biosynthesis glycosyltransferase